MLNIYQKLLQKLYQSVNYSLKGIRWCFKHEVSFRLELYGCIPLSFLWAIMDISLLWKAILFQSLMFVLVFEILNSSIEVTINRISPERNFLSGLAKDLGSGAVFISLITCCILWFIALWEWRSLGFPTNYIKY